MEEAAAVTLQRWEETEIDQQKTSCLISKALICSGLRLSSKVKCLISGVVLKRHLNMTYKSREMPEDKVASLNDFFCPNKLMTS